MSPIGNEAEQILAFQCAADKLPPFVQNYKFHPTRKFEIDLAFVNERIGVEINGGIFIGGAHGSPIKILRDMEKSNLLVIGGWRVLRYTPMEVRKGVAIAEIKQLMGVK